MQFCIGSAVQDQETRVKIKSTNYKHMAQTQLIGEATIDFQLSHCLQMYQHHIGNTAAAAISWRRKGRTKHLEATCNPIHGHASQKKNMHSNTRTSSKEKPRKYREKARKQLSSTLAKPNAYH